jgi:hypothetical protein
MFFYIRFWLCGGETFTTKQTDVKINHHRRLFSASSICKLLQGSSGLVLV